MYAPGAETIGPIQPVNFRAEARGETSSGCSVSGSLVQATNGLRSGGQTERPLICVLCRAPIALLSHQVEVQGGFHHTFANPHGILFRIGCFSEAPGCRSIGMASDEFPWFVGYVWRVCLCAQCGSHLGWLFDSEKSSFHGLIIDRLMQQEAGQPPEDA